jgi:hypothetical protein
MHHTCCSDHACELPSCRYTGAAVHDLEDVTRRMQMLGAANFIASDQSHKFALHCGALATDKLMNEHAQIITYNLSAVSKSQQPYKTNADLLFVERLKKLAKDGCCPLPRCFVSDDPRNEEARFGPRMPWLICGDPDMGRQGKRIRFQPSGMTVTVVVDRSNFDELAPSLLGSPAE